MLALIPLARSQWRTARSWPIESSSSTPRSWAGSNRAIRRLVELGLRRRGNRTVALLLFTLPARQLPDLRRIDSRSRNSWPAAYLSAAILRDRDRRRFIDKAAVHEVTNVGSDRRPLSRMTEQARAAIGSEAIEAVADRGYYSGEEIVACEQAGVTV